MVGKQTAFFLLTVFAAASSPAVVDQRLFKAGYWTVHVKYENKPGGVASENTRFVCRNPEFDQWMRDAAVSMARQMGCKVVAGNLTGGTFTSETHCLQSGSQAVTKIKSEMNGDTAEHSEIMTTFDPPQNGRTQTTMTSDQKWISDCPAGVSAGDSVSEDGKITHLWRH